jgi:hypothetical protein
LVLPGVVTLCPKSRAVKDSKQRREKTRLIDIQGPGI